MKVHELVERLRALPQDAEVVLPMESDFDPCRYVGMHESFRGGRSTAYIGSVHVRFAWELDEDLEGKERGPRVVVLTTDEKPELAP